MNVVMLCCYVRRKMRVCDVVLRNALKWLHGCCIGFVLGGSSGTAKPCVFSCKVAAAEDERYLVCAAGAAAVVLTLFLPQWNCGFKLLWLCLCVRSFRVIWNHG